MGSEAWAADLSNDSDGLVLVTDAGTLSTDDTDEPKLTFPVTDLSWALLTDLNVSMSRWHRR
jgi:hypothetical protein